jgi:hypothetical protein
MLCTFIRTTGLPGIYINPQKVCVVEPMAGWEVLITFDNGGSVIVTGTADTVADRIGEALMALSSPVRD